jgi:hypothetical protein
MYKPVYNMHVRYLKQSFLARMIKETCSHILTDSVIYLTHKFRHGTFFARNMYDLLISDFSAQDMQRNSLLSCGNITTAPGTIVDEG